MADLIEILRALTAAVYALLALAAFREWRRRGGEAAGWLAATFGTLGAVAVAARFLPEHSDSLAILWIRKVEVAIIVLFPYFLYRFAASFRGPSRRLDAAAALLTAALAIGALLLPEVPEQGQSRPPLFQAYVYLLAAQWVFLSSVFAARLWRSGRGQPTVARRRMRTLSAGSLGLALAIVIAGAASTGEEDAITLVTQVLALLSAPFFMLGFSPPTIVRMAWRRTEEAALREAEAELMSALTPAEVAKRLLPHAARLVGGRGAVLIDTEGNVIDAQGVSDAEAEMIAASPPPAREAAGYRVEEETHLLNLPMQAGRLVVQTGPHTPFFGREEVDLLGSLAVLVDLALERAYLFGREQEAREGLEQANADLEAFLRGVSHDLRNPLFSVTGHLESLRLDYGQVLPEEGRHYLERMSVSAQYMQALINDLMELSEIGHVTLERERVDLEALVSEIAAELKAAHPRASFEIGALPGLNVRTLRARQLFTNLLDNAVRHAGREDVAVRVAAERAPDGSWTISVADNGQGIPPAYREKVFAVFERLAEAQEVDPTSTGIGLSICRKIVELGGGRIWVADAREGAEIRISLPADLVRE